MTNVIRPEDEKNMPTHHFQIAHEGNNCQLCDQPKRAQVHWVGDGPLPNDRTPEDDDPMLTGARPGAGIYEPFDWELS